MSVIGEGARVSGRHDTEPSDEAVEHADLKGLRADIDRLLTAAPAQGGERSGDEAIAFVVDATGNHFCVQVLKARRGDRSGDGVTTVDELAPGVVDDVGVQLAPEL